MYMHDEVSRSSSTHTRAQLAAFGRMTTLLLDRAAKATPYRPTAASLLTEAESTALLALFPSTDTVASEEERVEAFIRLLLDGGPSVIAAVRAMGPHCACLPAHESGWAEVEGMIDETAALVGRLCRGKDGLCLWIGVRSGGCRRLTVDRPC